MNQGEEQEQSVIYFGVLIVIEILVFILSLATKQNELMFFNIIRILCLLGAKCMQSVSWVVQYIIFAFICALYSFDPVGLWITGHGQHLTKVQNAFCVIIFLGLSVAVYIAYLFKKMFEKEIEEDFVGEGYSNPNANLFGGGERANQQNNNRFMYRAAENTGGPNQPQRRSAFKQFSGQGYSLE